MFARTLFLTLTCACLLQAAPPDQRQLERLITDAREAWQVPGVAVVLVDKTKVLYLQGHGVREVGGAPVTPDTLFPLASCSKAFTSALVGGAVDDGVLAWDDRVSKYVKEFHLSDPAADALVTVRDLLSHRTGVGPHDLLWYRTPWNQDEAIRRIAKLPLSQPFRGGMQYQSVMYMAAGRALEKATGKAWATLLQERLLHPLGMKSTFATTKPTLAMKDRATGYWKNKAGVLERTAWYNFDEANAAGSISSTASDLAAWLRLHLNDGLHGETRLISAENLRETRIPQITIRHEGTAVALSPESVQMNYALGWVSQDYRGRLLVQHAGLIDGYRVHLTLLPNEGYAWAILANRDATRLNLALSNSLADLVLQHKPRDWNKYYLDIVAEEETAALVQAKAAEQNRQRDTTPSVPLADLAGSYTHPAYGKATVRVERDHLVWEWSSWKIPLEHYHHDIFQMRADHPRFEGFFLRFMVRDGKVRSFGLRELQFDRD